MTGPACDGFWQAKQTKHAQWRQRSPRRVAHNTKSVTLKARVATGLHPHTAAGANTHARRALTAVVVVEEVARHEAHDELPRPVRVVVKVRMRTFAKRKGLHRVAAATTTTNATHTTERLLGAQVRLQQSAHVVAGEHVGGVEAFHAEHGAGLAEQHLQRGGDEDGGPSYSRAWGDEAAV